MRSRPLRSPSTLPQTVTLLPTQSASLASAPPAPVATATGLRPTASAPAGSVRFDPATAQLAARLRRLRVPLPTLRENATDQEAADALVRTVSSERAAAAAAAAGGAKPAPPATPLADIDPAMYADVAFSSDDDDAGGASRFAAAVLALLDGTEGEY